MTVTTKTIQVKSVGEGDMINLTEQTSRIVEECKIVNGTVTVFVSGSTAAVTTIEYEPGLEHDFPAMLSRLAPSNIDYEHNNTWHDGNGHSHVRASLVGPSLTIPFVNRNLLLGTWQQIVLIEMDTQSRRRNIVVQVMGE